ncbi:hypothetical protein EDD11_004513 [Mortierella claussenii]|nr:hypothetical protein EDD11_004513 [Mortierella claussenii]
MLSSNAFNFDAQQQHQDSQEASPSFRRETTEDMSKMYTTLYDSEDPLLQQEYAMYQQQMQQQQSQFQLPQESSQQAIFDALLNTQQNYVHDASAASPSSSCYSGSSPSFSDRGSVHSSPVTRQINHSDEANELANIFHIDIDDLLAGDVASFNYATESTDVSNLDLFGPFFPDQQQQPFDIDFEYSVEQHPYLQYQQQLQQHQQRQHQHYQHLHSQCSSSSPSPLMSMQTFTHGGQQRSGSLSPVTAGAPHAAVYSSAPSSSSSSACNLSRCSPAPQSPEHCSSSSDSEMPHSPQTSYTAATLMSPIPRHTATAQASPSTDAATSTAAATAGPSTPTTVSNLPNTAGMTVIKSEDGSIMVYNPATESMTFRCELCPVESFGRIHDLKRHQASKHKEVTWPCEFCHRRFVRRDALLRHYTVKSNREDGVHPASYEAEKLLGARARAKLIC